MKKAVIFILVTVLFSQVILAFIMPFFLTSVRLRILYLQCSLPSPVELAMLLSHGVGALVHVLPVFASGYLALRIFLKRKQPDYNPVNALLGMFAIAVFQIAAGVFCALSLLWVFHS
jgi:hypothetical protein